MQFAVNRRSFLDAVISVSMPKAKCNVLDLEVKGKEIMLNTVSESGELQMSYRMKTGIEEIKKIGSAAVALHDLIIAIKNLQAESIDLSTTENCLKLEAPNAIFQFPLRAKTNKLFEVPNDEREPELISLRAELLHEALDKVAFATAVDDVRIALNGVSLKFAGDELITTATDGSRIARFAITFVEDFNLMEEVILPNSFARELIRITPEISESVLIKLGRKTASFEIDDLCICGRFIDALFPDCERFFQEEAICEACVLKNEFSQALREISSVNSDSVILQLQKDKLKLFAENPLVGRATIQVYLSANGEVKQKFNLRSLREAINKIKDDKVLLRFGKERPTIIISPANKKAEDFTYLLLAMKD